MDSFIESLKKLWSNRKIKISTIISLVVILLFLFVYACSSVLNSKQKKFYKIARPYSWGDLDLYGKERNLQGFIDDLIFTIADKEGVGVELFYARSDQILIGLDNGNYDGIISHLPVNDSNKIYYLFSDPFILFGPVLVVNKSSNIEGFKQMEGKILGIKSGSSAILNVERDPKIIIITYETINSAIENLTNNKIDGVVMELWLARALTEGFYSDRLKIVTKPLNNSGLRLITLNEKKWIPLIESFNKALEEIRESGVFHELVLKWSLRETES